MKTRTIAAAGLMLAALGLTACGSSPSKYYHDGYRAGQSAPVHQDDTLQGNQVCVNVWNQDVNSTGEEANLEGQAAHDYMSGWVAGCENAPYGQDGNDVPGQ